LGSVKHDEVIGWGDQDVTLHNQMTQYARFYKDQWGRKWDMTVTQSNAAYANPSSGIPFAPTYGSGTNGDTMSFYYATSQQNRYGWGIDPGDILFSGITGTIWVVLTVGASDGTNNLITTRQQNNLITAQDNSNTFVKNLNPQPDLSFGTWNEPLIIIKTGAYIPSVLNYGTFTVGSPNVTNITWDVGTPGSSDMANKVMNGDQFFGVSDQYGNRPPDRLWPFAHGTVVSAVTDGTPGSLTLSKNALVSGVYPIFPYELVGAGDPLNKPSTWFQNTISIGNQTPSPDVMLGIQLNYYDPTPASGQSVGVSSLLVPIAYSADVTTQTVGGQFSASPSGSHNFTGTVIGLFGQAQSGTSGIVFTEYGINGSVYNTGTGRILQGYALVADIQNLTAGGTIDDARCLYAASGFNYGGTIANWYGLYVDPPPAPNAPTNSWAIYVEGDTPSQFNGQIKTSPSTASRSGIVIPSGTAPTSPVDGAMWNDGNNINVRIGSTTQVLGTVTLNQFTITSGATSGSPYIVPANMQRILVNKTTGAPTYIQFPTASSVSTTTAGLGVLVKDIKGDAATNNIILSFSGGELCDGQSTVTLSNARAWVTINPVPGGGAWYQS